MAIKCASCERPIEGSEMVDRCLGDHPDRDEDAGLEEAMLLHDDCPCPVHGWDADRDRLFE